MGRCVCSVGLLLAAMWMCNVTAMESFMGLFFVDLFFDRNVFCNREGRDFYLCPKYIA